MPESALMMRTLRTHTLDAYAICRRAGCTATLCCAVTAASASQRGQRAKSYTHLCRPRSAALVPTSRRLIGSQPATAGAPQASPGWRCGRGRCGAPPSASACAQEWEGETWAARQHAGAATSSAHMMCRYRVPCCHACAACPAGPVPLPNVVWMPAPLSAHAKRIVIASTPASSMVGQSRCTRPCHPCPVLTAAVGGGRRGSLVACSLQTMLQ